MTINIVCRALQVNILVLILYVASHFPFTFKTVKAYPYVKKNNVERDLSSWKNVKTCVLREKFSQGNGTGGRTNDFYWSKVLLRRGESNGNRI